MIMSRSNWRKPVPVSFNTPQIPYVLVWNRNRGSVVRGRRLTAWDKTRPKLIKGFIKWQLFSKLEAMSGYSSAHGKLRARKWPRIIHGSEQTRVTSSNNIHVIRGKPNPEQSWFRHGLLLHLVDRNTQQVINYNWTVRRTFFLGCLLLIRRKVMICSVYLLRNVLTVWPIYLMDNANVSSQRFTKNKQKIN